MKPWRDVICRRALPLAWLGAAILMTAGVTPASAQRISTIRDAEIETLLNDYARPIFRIADLGSQRIRIRIVRSKAFNAFVLDGGNIFINTGALLISETPNQVIGVLAHETGHIAKNHLASKRRRIKQDTSRLLLMKVLGIAAIAAGAVGGESTREITGGIGKSILTGSESVTRRGILAYDRVLESEADQVALSYLNATKQSAQGMLDTFERFASQEVFSNRFKDPYVRSHPMPQARIAQLRNLAKRSAYFSRRDPHELQLRHDLMRAKLSGYLDRPNVVFNRYPKSDQSLPARYARAIASFFSGGLDAAIPRIDQLIQARPNYPFFWELKGDFYIRRGQPDKAIRPLRKALALAPKSGLIRIQLAQVLLESGNPANLNEVITLLSKALVTEKTPNAYRRLATAYWKKGREGEAYLATARAHFMSGRTGDAKRFAKRAQVKFKKGSRQWLNANDIVKHQGPPQ